MHHILILDLGGSAIHAQIVHTPVTIVVAQISTSNHNDLVHNYDTIDCLQDHGFLRHTCCT
jgi:hypothetical protein